MKLDNKWMKIALEEANLGKEILEVPVGAVLVDLKTNKLISKSSNKVECKSNPLAHAELEVILDGLNYYKKKYLKNTAIYITLEPCLICAAAISRVKIAKIYFGAYDNKDGSIENGIRLFNNKLYFKPEIYGGIMENECSILIKNFFRKIRKNKLI